jgi:hypothetical protein
MSNGRLYSTLDSYLVPTISSLALAATKIGSLSAEWESLAIEELANQSLLILTF